VNAEEERKGLWIPPEEIRALGRICWDRRRAIGKGQEEGERFVSSLPHSVAVEEL